MKFAVVVFPGSNCDDDMIHVLGNVLDADVRKVWHKEHNLGELTTEDCVILPGGFSYGDYLRCGAIAKFSPIMQSVVAFANSGGFVYGICNGFQILCETGLLPGVLLRNSNQKFISKEVYLRSATAQSALTRGYPVGQVVKMPVAHAEGRYHIDPEGLESLRKNDQILFQYCDASGTVNASANINGSMDNIAGICNRERNVFGMMPHPERASEEILGNRDGKMLFDSLVQTSVKNVLMEA